jgi:hypothetical protein
MGTPGKYSNEEVTRKKSSPTQQIDGSGFHPGRMGLHGGMLLLLKIDRDSRGLK